MNEIASELGIKSMEEWYNIKLTSNSLLERLVRQAYSSSLVKALTTIYSGILHFSSFLIFIKITLGKNGSLSK